MGHKVGLDYLVAFAMLDFQALPKDEAKRMFDDLRVLERAALEAMNEPD